MIKTISLMGVASYSPDSPIVIDTNNEKVNLFYGLNGSGKSTIGKYLQNIHDSNYQSCELTPVDLEREILVYNDKFVTRNFYEILHQKGIFTLSEANKEVEETIESSKAIIDGVEIQQEELKEREKGINKDIYTEEITLKDSVWKSKIEYDRTSLEFCLAGYKTKDKFLKKVTESSFDYDGTLKDLELEAKELSDQDNVLIDAVIAINFDGFIIESDEVFEMKIVGSEDSYLAELIGELGNSDWVQSGIEYFNDGSPCPFCQQEVKADFSSSINELFDLTYKTKKNDILMLRNLYEKRINELKVFLNNTAYSHEYVTSNSEFKAAKKYLLDCLDSNLSLIDDKYIKPSESVEVLDTSSLLEKLNIVISNIQEKIDIFNDKINNKKVHLDKVNNQFWSLINSKHSGIIEASNSRLELLNDELDVIKDENSLIAKEKAKQNEVIIECSKNTTNIDASIRSINMHLKDLGLQGFQLVKESDSSQHYKIVRANQAEGDVYSTLSEGEKTLITFLYFLESCVGAANENSSVVLNRRVIVIDDPISSLSHNYVYDIAALIHHKILMEDFDQVFILTHNLFFFHEILMLKAPGSRRVPYNLFRVSKSNYSQIKVLNRNDIQNDYQNYWQIIKDCSENHSYASMLPNAMRNILEHYFNFIHKKDALRQVLEDLGRTSSEFKPLFRYINRESHSDSVNLNDFEGINVENYIDKFQQVFEKTGYSQHYSKMMGLEECMLEES